MSSTSQSAPTPTSPISLTSEVRDELVRMMMPELRALTEHLVKASIERSIASLLERQRELEVKVERSSGASIDESHAFEAKLEAAIAPLLAKQGALETLLAAKRHAAVHPEPLPLLGSPTSPPTRAAVQRPMPVEYRAMGPSSDALAARALGANALDIPKELNGSRRKRIVVFLLLLTVIGILGTVCSLSVMSHMAPHP